jgi:hypothetical protein
MNRFLVITLTGCLCFLAFGCKKSTPVEEPITVVPESDPMQVLPAVVDDETDAKIYEVHPPEPRVVRGETVYPIYYGSAVAVTKNRAEWENWLRDPSLAPLPNLRDDRSFVLRWCHQLADMEPEDVALFLMNYFEYDLAYLHPSNPWHYANNPTVAFFDWAGLRRCIEDKRLVCAGYAQLFYLIVKERYPGIKYITSDELCHARNYFEDEHWDLTWLDDAGENYNPDRIKFDFVGMQKRIANGLNGRVGRDWIEVNLQEGAASR